MDNSFTCNVDDVSISVSGLRTQSVLRMLQLKGRTLIPVVQGGMGVGISAGGLAGAVARAGGLGTISSVDLVRPAVYAQYHARPSAHWLGLLGYCRYFTATGELPLS